MTQYIPYAGQSCTCPRSTVLQRVNANQSTSRRTAAPKSKRKPPIPTDPNTELPPAGRAAPCSLHDLETRRQIDQVAKYILDAKRCLVVSGAGISCSAGIPDFRSASGLFTTLKEKHGGVINQGRDLFDAQLFNNEATTRIFHQFIGQFKQSIAHVQPTATHQFISWLHDQGRLTRWYTQNIDGLEAKTGLPVLGQLRDRTAPAPTPSPAEPVDPEQRTMNFFPPRGHSPAPTLSSQSGEDDELEDVEDAAPLDLTPPSPYTPSRISRDPRSVVVPLHGDLDQLVCRLCSAYYPFTPAFFSSYQNGEAPTCPKCVGNCHRREASGRRAISVGRLRPNIVLYNEPHPAGELIAKVLNTDVRHKPDLLLILGTRLNVYGCKNMVKTLARAVRQRRNGKVIMINLDPIHSKEWEDLIDIQVLGPADDLIRDIIRVRDAQTCLTQFWGPGAAAAAAVDRSPRPSTTVLADKGSRPASRKRIPTEADTDRVLPKLKRARSAPVGGQGIAIASDRDVPTAKKLRTKADARLPTPAASPPLQPATLKLTTSTTQAVDSLAQPEPTLRTGSMMKISALLSPIKVTEHDSLSPSSSNLESPRSPPKFKSLKFVCNNPLPLCLPDEGAADINQLVSSPTPTTVKQFFTVTKRAPADPTTSGLACKRKLGLGAGGTQDGGKPPRIPVGLRRSTRLASVASCGAL
ncbi:NAD-dependent deacetylase hst3 [Tieghemiomyces parasiticus]|uniref:NAD-dependent deacetylase hst3 n=1 Tax=Tieghemiomyces parasiticus TaxID=78921 RepID=A0A9W7ZWS2_9FUNG|nr:NAD-dependent deacetylase hst3 [Tieghemiomyces parasiticus]